MACALHTPAGEKVMRGLAEGGSEESMEVKGRKAGFLRRAVQQYLRLILRSQQIARPAQTAERVIMQQGVRLRGVRHGAIVTGRPLTGAGFAKNIIVSGEYRARFGDFHLIFLRGHT